MTRSAPSDSNFFKKNTFLYQVHVYSAYDKSKNAYILAIFSLSELTEANGHYDKGINHFPSVLNNCTNVQIYYCFKCILFLFQYLVIGLIHLICSVLLMPKSIRLLTN